MGRYPKADVNAQGTSPGDEAGTRAGCGLLPWACVPGWTGQLPRSLSGLWLHRNADRWTHCQGCVWPAHRPPA